MFRHLQSFVMQPNDRKERETLCSPRRAHHSLVPPLYRILYVDLLITIVKLKMI